MAEFTLLELHLDDATITANAPFTGSEDATLEATGVADGVSVDRSPLLGLVALAAVAFLARRLLDSRRRSEWQWTDDEGRVSITPS